jgi:hypothetical protein
MCVNAAFPLKKRQAVSTIRATTLTSRQDASKNVAFGTLDVKKLLVPTSARQIGKGIPIGRAFRLLQLAVHCNRQAPTVYKRLQALTYTVSGIWHC